jgi:hypothetical protein
MSVGLYAISLMDLLIVDDVDKYDVIRFLSLLLWEDAGLLLLEMLLDLIEGDNLGGEGETLIGRLATELNIDAAAPHFY